MGSHGAAIGKMSDPIRSDGAAIGSHATAMASYGAAIPLYGIAMGSYGAVTGAAVGPHRMAWNCHEIL